jgi:hypothetical protein
VGPRAGLEVQGKSGFDPRTVRPISSRYAHYAVPAHKEQLEQRLNSCLNHTTMAVTLRAFCCHGSTWKSVFSFTYRPTFSLGKEFVAVDVNVVWLSEPVLTWK